MKKINYIFIALGFFCSVLVFVFIKDIWAFVNIILPTTLMTVGVNKSAKMNKLMPLTFFNIWITLYNFLYFSLKCSSGIDLFSVPWHTFVHFFVPYLITMFLFYKKKQ